MDAVGQGVLDWLIEHNFNQDFGARPLKRAVERHLEDPLSEEILRGNLDGPHKIMASMVDGKISFKTEKVELPKPVEEPDETADTAAGSGEDAPSGT